MTVTEEAPVAVDPAGTEIEILAVRFGQSPFVERTPDGSLIAYAETWDAQSLVLPASRVRLLRFHDRTRALGWLDHFWTEPDGVHASGHLVGSANKLDEARALIGSGLAADVSIGFTADLERDEWTAPQRRNGLAAVRRRGARLREVSVVDAAGIPGSRVLGVTRPQPGPSTATTTALAEADDAVRGTGVAARQRIDQQAEAVLAWAEADALVAAGQRWANLLDQPEPAPTPPPPEKRQPTWAEIRDAEIEAGWQRAREDEARAEVADILRRRQLAEDYNARHAAERASILRAMTTR